MIYKTFKTQLENIDNQVEQIRSYHKKQGSNGHNDMLFVQHKKRFQTLLNEIVEEVTQTIDHPTFPITFFVESTDENTWRICDVSFKARGLFDGQNMAEKLLFSKSIEQHENKKMSSFLVSFLAFVTALIKLHKEHSEQSQSFDRPIEWSIPEVWTPHFQKCTNNLDAISLLICGDFNSFSKIQEVVRDAKGHKKTVETEVSNHTKSLFSTLLKRHHTQPQEWLDLNATTCLEDMLLINAPYQRFFEHRTIQDCARYLARKSHGFEVLKTQSHQAFTQQSDSTKRFVVTELTHNDKGRGETDHQRSTRILECETPQQAILLFIWLVWVQERNSLDSLWSFLVVDQENHQVTTIDLDMGSEKT